jgi:hypothetical protein
VIFTKRLCDGVRSGDITCRVRIWMRPHVKVGGRYQMEEGQIGRGENVYLVQFHYVPPTTARTATTPGRARRRPPR